MEQNNIIEEIVDQVVTYFHEISLGDRRYDYENVRNIVESFVINVIGDEDVG